MSSDQIREKYLKFFEERGHKIVPSASLLPENDLTTLFTSSGMQSMLRYLLGEQHSLGKRITDVQKCFRADDIVEVGDNRHTTFFEMLGNWSFGDYFKREQLVWIFEFLTKEIGLNPQKIYVSVFRGNEKLNLPRDSESAKNWQEIFQKAGIEAKAIDFSERNGMQGGRIFYYDEKKNWWSRQGIPENMSIGEPGGPDSEMFWDFGAELKLHENSQWADQPCHINCDCGRFLEIGNNVFMEYIKTAQGFESLPQKNVDFGGGLERIAAAKINNPDIFETDAFFDLMGKIKKSMQAVDNKIARILADHLRAATFLIADGVLPSNKEAGYVLRRLLRRILAYQVKYGIEDGLFSEGVKIISKKYKAVYPETDNAEKILAIINEESQKFRDAIKRGLKELEKTNKVIDSKTAFRLYETFGLPFDLISELASESVIVKINKDDFDKEFEKHQNISRAGAEKKFGGHGFMQGHGLTQGEGEEKIIKLHTATHLLQWALREVLGKEVHQMGSDINAERLRFDFSFPRKMTIEEIKKVESLVNEKIQAGLPVSFEELLKAEADKIGALSFFREKYPERVKVYFIGRKKDFGGNFLSAEFCGGPHVENTSQIGQFKILKEESSSARVRRIKATIL